MTPITPEDILAHLASAGVAPLRVVDHGETRTSEESAAARGEPLSVGGKAILLKVADEFALFVLPADRKLSTAAIRARFGVRSIRFATREELLAMTGLVPGSVPPFGRPLLPFRLHVDEAIRGNDRVAFNAASLTRSVVLRADDYLLAAAPAAVFSFAEAISSPSPPASSAG